jgi:hypothetical protein
LISTKRMDSSFGKNAANRVEESYGVAKNLRLRQRWPRSASSTACARPSLSTEPDKAEWLIDLLANSARGRRLPRRRAGDDRPRRGGHRPRRR